jgi:hypothetical protein
MSAGELTTSRQVRRDGVFNSLNVVDLTIIGNLVYSGTISPGDIRLPNGTLAAPSLSFTSDTDLGLHRAGANNLGIAATTVTLSPNIAVAITHAANGAADDLTISQTGAFDASLHLSSAGTGVDALTLISAGGIDITAATNNIDIVATAGNVNVTAGVFGLGAATKFAVDAAGGDAIAGTATLVAGTATVLTSAVTASSLIQICRNTPGGVAGDLSVPSASIVAATSFVINSANAADTSTVNWFIIN